jgi:rRNA-processing protein FCF1
MRRVAPNKHRRDKGASLKLGNQTLIHRLFPQKAILTDTCVIIDLLKVDKKIIKLISKHVGRLYTLNRLVEEITTLKSPLELKVRGFVLKDPDVLDVIKAESDIERLSFCDKLSFFTAQRNNHYLATNDRLLRRYCEQNNVPVFWGLDLLVELYKSKGIYSDEVKKAALIIKKSNKRLTDKRYKDFIDIIDSN